MRPWFHLRGLFVKMGVECLQAGLGGVAALRASGLTWAGGQLRAAAALKLGFARGCPQVSWTVCMGIKVFSSCDVNKGWWLRAHRRKRLWGWGG